jgi:hypothetical protein
MPSSGTKSVQGPHQTTKALIVELMIGVRGGYAAGACFLALSPPTEPGTVVSEGMRLFGSVLRHS